MKTIQINPPKRITKNYLESVLIEINRANGLPDGDTYERDSKGNFTTKKGTLVMRCCYGATGISAISSDGGTGQYDITGLGTPREALNTLFLKINNL